MQWRKSAFSNSSELLRGTVNLRLEKMDGQDFKKRGPWERILSKNYKLFKLGYTEISGEHVGLITRPMS